MYEGIGLSGGVGSSVAGCGAKGWAGVAGGASGFAAVSETAAAGDASTEDGEGIKNGGGAAAPDEKTEDGGVFINSCKEEEVCGAASAPEVPAEESCGLPAASSCLEF